MFYLSRIEHTFRVPPSLLNLPIEEAIKGELEKLFLDKVIADLGLCVSVYDIKSIEGGFIFPSDGAATYTVVFRLIMFRPFVGEIIAAKVKESNATGLRLSIGFFDDIYIPAHLFPKPSSFKPDPNKKDKGTWEWEYDEEPYIIDGIDEIKFRVHNVIYPPIPIEQPKEAKPFAPMVITGSIDEDGLGPVSWWVDAEETKES
nr:DNA-directed RNA polymerase III subunit RPC8 isoform X1 [Quercus suber]POE81070.1 dna-directed rna polymerase iii subunit rpc8 [Quercus suber]